MIKIFIINFFFISFIAYSFDNEYYKSIVIKTNLKKNEIIIIIFQDNNSCIKCFTIPNSIINASELKSKSKVHKKLAFIKCSREIETIIFKKKRAWNGEVMRSQFDTKSRLSLNQDTEICVFDFFGNHLLSFNTNQLNDFGKCTDELTNLLVKYQKKFNYIKKK